jgi:hypothetical protein
MELGPYSRSTHLLSNDSSGYGNRSRSSGWSGMSILLPFFHFVGYLEEMLMIVNDEFFCFNRWWSLGFCISWYLIIRSYRRIDGMSSLPRITSKLMEGTRIRLQSLLSYLLLETVDIRHYLFRIRDRFNVIIR